MPKARIGWRVAEMGRSMRLQIALRENPDAKPLVADLAGGSPSELHHVHLLNFQSSLVSIELNTDRE